MLKNRMLELSRYSNRTTSVGSKLTTPLITPGTKFDEFTDARDLLRRVNIKTQEINDLRRQYKRIANPYREKQISSQIDNIIQDDKTLLKGLEKEIKFLNGKFVTSSDVDGSKRAITMDLTRKAKTATEKFRGAQKSYTMAVRQTIKRHAIIIQGKVTEEEVDQILANPDKAQEMLMTTLMSAPSVQLENAVSDIVDKCRDIMNLERNIQECFEMQQELGLLVQLQGEQINSIEATITDAKEYVEDGEKALDKAEQTHKSSNKKIFCIILLVVLLIGIIVIPVVIITQV